MTKTEPLIRLRRKLGVETLWLFLLAELARGKSHPYKLVSAIKERYGFDAGRVLPYVVLKKLEAEGYVESYVEGNRHYYRITDKGRELLVEGLKYIESILEKLKVKTKKAVKIE